ncbi:MAG: DUF2341 domain-containing protein, partial [Desulfobacterales bacterium]|nr:DUF2341 domain-containing protein [Desulfobacterales bacterium]
YGNAGASNQENVEGVWDSNYLMVQHMKDKTSSSIEDSTSNNFDGTKAGANEPVEDSGKIYQAQDFDGSNDYINTGFNALTREHVRTIEAWIKTSDTGDYTGYGGSCKVPLVGTVTPYIGQNHGIEAGKATFHHYDGGWRTLQGTSTVADGNWHYLAFVQKASWQMDLYVDDNKEVSNGDSTISGGQLLYIEDIGRSYGISYANAVIDEIRISNVARSDGWVITTFRNENDPSSFYTIGSEEPVHLLVPLSPGESTTLTLTVAIPEDAVPCTVDNITATATSQENAEVTDSDTCSAHAAPIVHGVDVSISPEYQENLVGETLEYEATVTNEGNVPDTYDLTVSDTEDWLEVSGWSHMKKITIDHTKVDADLIDFPVLIDITDSDLASRAQDDGDDIVFADYYGIKFNHEIELYDNNTGHLVAWVRADLSASSDTILYMYYGNAGASNQENVEGVWDSNYLMVQH